MPFPAELADASCHATKNTRIYWVIAVIVWTALILFSSTSLAEGLAEKAFDALSALLFQGWRSTPEPYSPVHLFADKGVHVSLFTVFAILLWKALPDLSRKLGYVILTGTAVGCGSEFLQRFFPGRDPAWRDVCINAAATTLGAVISSWLFRSKTQPEALLSDAGLDRQGGRF